MSTPAVTVLIEIHAKPGREGEARDSLVHAIRTTSKPGMRSSSVYADASDAATFYAIQKWDAEQDFKIHMDEIGPGQADATEMLSEPPKIRVLVGLPTRQQLGASAKCD